MEWTSSPKPAELAESRLIDAILEGIFPIHSTLPAERELAQQLRITRPTLREALQRMARSGWVEIRQGKSTRVRDYWREGNLGVLADLARRTTLPVEFVPNLLHVRALLAPAYARLAVERAAPEVAMFLWGYLDLTEEASAYASYDWELHHRLTVLSGNPIFTLILNGFATLYPAMARCYFELPDSRRTSRIFYAQLLQAAQDTDPTQAYQITTKVMHASLGLWQRLTSKISLESGASPEKKSSLIK